MDDEHTSGQVRSESDRKNDHAQSERASKSSDNPDIGKGTGEGDGGLGSQTGALGGDEAVEPDEPAGTRTPPDQLHPHGESGR